jgi:hypothetical protein
MARNPCLVFGKSHSDRCICIYINGIPKYRGVKFAAAKFSNCRVRCSRCTGVGKCNEKPSIEEK